ncbi:MAG: class I SAM-dependent methyltransferase [Hasllibacter sp.]
MTQERGPAGLSGEGAEFEDFHLLNPKGLKRLGEKYADAAVEGTLPIRWGERPYNRIALMNHLANRIGPGCAYLEIGCDANQLFSSLPLGDKTGVDPVSGGTRRMTSDAFFAGNDRTFDLVFLDGLHTYEQLRRDVGNALRVTRPGGWIGIHDLVPLNWKQAHVPRLQLGWNGDVWKVGVELARSEGIPFHIVMIDHGVGLIRVPEGDAPLRDMRPELTGAGFDVFLEAFPELPTLSWQEGLDWIASFPDAPE